MKRSSKLLALGLAMMAAGQVTHERPSKADIKRGSDMMRQQWLEDNRDVPLAERRPDLVNFDPMVPDHPTVICGFEVGDRVHIELRSFVGDGVITAISTRLDVGDASKLFPMYQVRFHDGLSEWFANRCFTRIDGPTRR